MSDGAAPRAYTNDEVTERLLSYLAVLVKYWATVPSATTVEERLSGLVFSVLATLDGSAASLPAFVLAPCPHPEDREFLEGEGENWYPEASPEIASDIAGSLHERWGQHAT